jgi:hypothetical protein
MNSSCNDSLAKDQVLVVGQAVEVVPESSIRITPEAVGAANLEAAKELANVLRSKENLLDEILGS